MRINTLFWNYNTTKGLLMRKERNKADPLARLVKSQAIDFVTLADCKLSDGQILDTFGNHGLDFAALKPPHLKVKLLRRSTAPNLVPIVADDRVQFVRTDLPGFQDILIGVVHLPDRQNHPLPIDRHVTASNCVKTLVEAESRVKHSRTLVVGDFNMTPEEVGMVDPLSSFGALMSWDLARAQSAAKLQSPSRFFNPMWALMGRAEAPGTYYWNSGKNHNTYWYCLDGVIARHSLKGVFLDQSLEIVTTIPDSNNRGGPIFRPTRKHWKIDFSDHLPIRFDLQLKPVQTGASS